MHTGLLVAGFQRLPGQRAVLMEEVLSSVLPNLNISRARTQRAFVVGSSGGHVHPGWPPRSCCNLCRYDLDCMVLIHNSTAEGVPSRQSSQAIKA